MSEKYQNELLLTIKTSKRLRGLVILIHAIAVCASFATALVMVIKLSLCIVIFIDGWLTLKRLHVEQYKIKYTEALGWEIAKNCDFVRVDILKSTVITTFALFLHFKFAPHSQSWNSKYRNSLLISSDSLGEQDYRWLIVKLKTTVAK
jgi:hypothetical protein